MNAAPAIRFALGVEYDGGAFRGWQRSDESVPSVQAALEDALSKVANQPISVTCSGRTDAGVHARCQVVHFDSDVRRDARAWLLGATANLPRSVAVAWCQPVASDFNARFSAVRRRYRYSLLNRQTRPGFMSQYLAWELHPLDADAMHLAAQALVGEHDFSSFRSSQCEAPHARRFLSNISVTREGEVLHVDVEGNAFLHHMVRNIVGALLEVGKGRKSVNWLGELLDMRDRTQGGVTAPACGLVFIGPRYSENWNLPEEVTTREITFSYPNAV